MNYGRWYLEVVLAIRSSCAEDSKGSGWDGHLGSSFPLFVGEFGE